MGYRHYFYEIDKSLISEIKDLNIDQLDSKFDNILTLLYANDKELFCFGKLYTCNTSERIRSKGKPLFSNKETMDNFYDRYPYIVGKDGLLEAISCIENKILEYYKGLNSDNIGEHIEDKLFELKYSIVNLNENDKLSISSSDDYEYSIFDLVYLLKTFDWKNKTILFDGC